MFQSFIIPYVSYSWLTTVCKPSYILANSLTLRITYISGLSELLRKDLFVSTKAVPLYKIAGRNKINYTVRHALIRQMEGSHSSKFCVS